MSTITADHWGWQHASRNTWALHDITFTIRPGERVLLCGASGSGKSTLLRALAGILDPQEAGRTQGNLTVDGYDPYQLAGRIGYMQQDPEAQLVMSRCGDDVAFGCENIGMDSESIWPTVHHMLSTVGLHKGADHPTAYLSGGEKQRLALAGVLAVSPQLLLLDEPTANLDAHGAALVRNSLTEIFTTTHATVILVEHRISDVVELVNRIIVLDDAGAISADGPTHEVLASSAIHQAGIWTPDFHPAPRRSTGRPTTPLLRASDICIEAPRTVARAPHTALLRDVNIELHSGTTTAIVGPNGTGKSTLARVLGGLRPPLSGTVTLPNARGHRIRGKQLWKWPASTLADNIGTVFQNPEHQFLTDTVRSELLVARSDAAAQHRADELLHRLRLDHLAAANPFTLSGGEQRRLSVATALSTSPMVLIADEPTFGQDQKTWLELVDLFVELRDSGCALLLITHDMALVQCLADTVLHASDGYVRDMELTA